MSWGRPPAGRNRGHLFKAIALAAALGLMSGPVAGCDSGGSPSGPPENQAPTARFSYQPQAPEAGQEVTFDGSDSSDPDGAVAGYAWDFDGDGTADADGAEATWTFESRGEATVTLTVTDDAGGTSSAQQAVTVARGESPPANGPDLDPVGEARVTIRTAQGRAPISPYIYGSNQDLPGENQWTVRRLGGNRLTGYNWENNYSNAGSDYRQHSDVFLLTNGSIPEAQWDEPAVVMTDWHDESLEIGAETIITLQMAGYVAADDDGTVTEAGTAPSDRWHEVVFDKEGTLQSAPNRDDDAVYMDELVHALTEVYGRATAPDGIRWYSLDNEPALWSNTHPRIHPEKTGAQELVNKSVDLASAVKAVDPEAHVLGPALYGFGAYEDLQDAPDWGTVGGGYDWFISYYLDQMRQAGQEAGQRLLDVLDVHWYPEARGDSRITGADAITDADVAARLQAPRTLWDSTYTEGAGYIGDCCAAFLPILPRLQASIQEQYPGTGLAISEYDYGAKSYVSGGLAQADVLGAFGASGVDIATLWGIEPGDVYAAAGFALYRNYDGQGGRYGDTHVRSGTDDRENVSVWTSIEGEDASALHVILINKNREGAMDIVFDIESDVAYTRGAVWSFDAESPIITERAGVEAVSNDNRFVYTVPALSATHLVLRP